MLLSDKDIEKYIEAGEIKIKPFNAEQMQPDGYALRLYKNFRFVRIGDITHVDVKEKQELTEEVDLGEEGHVNVRPGELVLASSTETIKLGKGVAGLLQGRTSLSRLGLQLDVSAGMLSPGFEGRVTIALHNIFALPIRIYVGMRIAELSFIKMSSPVRVGYGDRRYAGRYQRQTGPTESRIWEDFE